jgi:chemotaxis protein methyltransferase CheR
VLNFKEFVKLRDFLYRKTGIYIEDSRYDSFTKKLQPYLEQKQFETFRPFFHALRFAHDNKILQEVINKITVNETYFYRENFQFEALIEEVLPKLDAQKAPNEVIRILCAPSSSGEEPYSIALSLLDENTLLSKRDIELVALDIDSGVIEKAYNGVYNKRSVQFIPEHLLKKYFRFGHGEFHINDTIKQAVNFQVANVMDRYQMKKLGKFDIIFSRNMLIYFDDESRREVGVTFYDLLKPKGYVFLGHSDKMSRISSLFQTIKLQKSLVYQKI